MDVRQYFRAIREVESSIKEEFPVVTSLDTDDGGKAGVITEVDRHNAAKLIVEQRARLSTEEEKTRYREALLAGIRACEEAEAAKRVAFDFIWNSEQRKASLKPKPLAK